MILGFSWVDLLLIATVLVLAASGLTRHRMPEFRRTAALVCLLLFVHVFSAGVRWQVLPAYVACLMVVATSLASRRWIRITIFPLSVLLLAATVVATWAFPLFHLPEPSGRYAVGVTRAFLTDESRPENYTPEKGDKRRLALTVWYPSEDPESGRATRYFEEPITRSRELTKGNPFPWFTFTHLGQVDVYARGGASVAEGRFPVVVYSHGLGLGWSSGNTLLAEELASHGYIFVAIGHSYIGSSVIFPDLVASFDPATRTAMNTEPPEDVMEIYGTMKEIQDPEEQLDVYMGSMAMMPVSIKGKVDEALETQVGDQAFVLEALPAANFEGVGLRSHLEMTKVGLIGMSIGGSASILTCEKNPTCTAVVNMDGFHPDQAAAKLPVPSMSLHRTDNLLVRTNYNLAESDAHLVEVANTTHFNFFDFALMSPLLQKMGILGAIPGGEGLTIQRDYGTSFFNKYLKSVSSPLIEGARKHESVNASLESR